MFQISFKAGLIWVVIASNCFSSDSLFKRSRILSKTYSLIVLPCKAASIFIFWCSSGLISILSLFRVKLFYCSYLSPLIINIQIFIICVKTQLWFVIAMMPCINKKNLRKKKVNKRGQATLKYKLQVTRCELQKTVYSIEYIVRRR